MSVRVVIIGGAIARSWRCSPSRRRSAGYEQDAYLGEVGAGVALAPNSMRVLRRLGVAEVSRRSRPALAGLRSIEQRARSRPA